MTPMERREYLGGGIFRKGETFYLILYHGGRRYVETCPARTQKQARLMRAKRVIEIKEGRFFEVRARKLFDALLAEYLDHSKAAKRSYPRDRQSARHLSKTFGKTLTIPRQESLGFLKTSRRIKFSFCQSSDFQWFRDRGQREAKPVNLFFLEYL